MQFPEFIFRLRALDPEVTRDFVAKYEPYIRRTIRRRIAHLRLQAAADSADVCQSALGTFLHHCAAGDFDLESPRGMEGLLITIARRKFAQLARRELAPRRDRRLAVDWESRFEPVTSSQLDPGQLAETRDVWRHLEGGLPAHERTLLRKRREGASWETIANEEGISSTLLRKRLSRALRRVIAESGLDEEHA